VFSDFSIASQIINDFNDIVGNRGFHVTEQGARPNSEEAGQKPTLPTILLAKSLSFANGSKWDRYRFGSRDAVHANIYVQARTMLEDMRGLALTRFDNMLNPTPWALRVRSSIPSA
jgi:hypothetical protein